MRARWLCSPPGGCGEAFLGRAGPRRERGAAWPGEVSSSLGSSAPLARPGCTSPSRTLRAYVRQTPTARFQTAPWPLKSLLNQPAGCAMLAAPPPHPHARTQAAGWEQLPAPELAGRGAAWGAAGRCAGKAGAGEGAGQGLPEEPAGVPGLTSPGIPVDTGTAAAEDKERPGPWRCSRAHLRRHCAMCPQGAAAHSRG